MDDGWWVVCVMKQSMPVKIRTLPDRRMVHCQCRATAAHTVRARKMSERGRQGCWVLGVCGWKQQSKQASRGCRADVAYPNLQPHLLRHSPCPIMIAATESRQQADHARNHDCNSKLKRTCVCGAADAQQPDDTHELL
eukprot:1702495-Rhodomonas_salina.1